MIRLVKNIGPGYDDFLWLMKALGKDDTRPMLQRVRVKDNEACTTDGMRLHVLKIDKDRYQEPIPNGVYNIIKGKGELLLDLTIESVDSFPDISRLFNHAIEASNGKESIRVNGSKRGHDTDISFAKLITSIAEKVALRFQFFSDMVEEHVFEAWVFSPTEPIYFKNETRYGLIMPLRIS